MTFRWGETLEDDPQQAPWPELADISISNLCTAGCGYCYRGSHSSGQVMTVAEYEQVLDELTHPELGPVFQVAIGGGEPTEHPDLPQILAATRARGVVPNYTTNGRGWSDELVQATARSCGAIAVSYDSHRADTLGLDASIDAARELGRHGVGANVHFVLSAQSIDLARSILRGDLDDRLQAFSAVVFLLLKPVGRANESMVLKPGEELASFLHLVQQPVTTLRIGFDACTVPLLLSATNVSPLVVDSCEGGFFSVYVDENLVCSPCSFATLEADRFDLKDNSFADVWARGFQDYRTRVRRRHTERCAGCRPFSECRGSCPYFDVLHLCSVASSSSVESQLDAVADSTELRRLRQ